MSNSGRIKESIQGINEDIQLSMEAKQSPFEPNQYLTSRKNYTNQSRLSQRAKERTRAKSEIWSYQEIKRIFTLYTEYGSKWKVIQSYFPDRYGLNLFLRTANSIKNRFYTVIRTFLKLMFRYHPYIKQKLPHQIASKIILKFYQGRQQFQKFGDFGKRILKMAQYDTDSAKLQQIVLENLSQIQQIYYLVFDIKLEQQRGNIQIKLQPKKYKSQGNNSIQKFQQYQSNKINPKSSPIDIHKTKTDIGENIQSQNLINGNQNPVNSIIYFVPVIPYGGNSQFGQFFFYQ